MKDTIVSFDTALIAKEKGFNYMKSSCFGDNMAYNLDDPTAIPACKANVAIGYILAPTQSLLQAWLREKHHLMVYITPYMNKNPDGEFKVTLFRLSDHFRLESFDGFKTYEEALEKGLQAALKLIKI